MKATRLVVIVLVVVVIAIVGLYVYTSLFTGGTGSTAWSVGANYPIQVGGTGGVAGQQCLSDGSYIYCIGGQDANGGPRSEVYSSSSLSSASANVTSWALGSNPYPQTINGQSCVASSGYAYCVGGSYDDGGDDVASSYYAPIGGGAVGGWNATTAYPIPIDTQSCVASAGYIYCVGGNNETDGTNADSISTTSAWYAPLSSSGVGQWNYTTPYPANVYFATCSASGGYIYCIGGANQNDDAVSTAYYAELSSSGVGNWTQTTGYPESGSGLACDAASGYIYCVGGQGELNSYSSSVYSAPVSSAGIGAWKKGPSYPQGVETVCAISSDTIYCVGGFDGSQVGENGAVYYVALASLLGTNSTG